MLRMSTLFLRTLREDPADAEVPSHKLLVRAGYVRRVAAGVDHVADRVAHPVLCETGSGPGRPRG